MKRVSVCVSYTARGVQLYMQNTIVTTLNIHSCQNSRHSSVNKYDLADITIPIHGCFNVLFML